MYVGSRELLCTRQGIFNRIDLKLGRNRDDLRPDNAPSNHELLEGLVYLAGVERTESSPTDAWIDMDDKITELHPEIFELPIDEWGSAVRDKLDMAFRDWWTLYSRSWTQGVLGADARQMSGELEIGIRGNKNRHHR